MTDLIVKKKTPLEAAAIDFAAMLNQIDTLEEIDAAVVATLGEMKLDYQDSIDRRVYFIQYLKSQISHVEGMAAAWKHRLDVLNNLESRIKESTVATMSAHPELKYKGVTGELRLQQNPVSLECDIPTNKRSYETVAESIALSPEYAPYIDHLMLYQLNKERIRGALADGIELPFARFKHGVHLRVKI